MGRLGFPNGSDGTESACNEEDRIPSLRQKDPLENSYPLQYSCLENSMNRGSWWAIVHRVIKNWP